MQNNIPKPVRKAGGIYQLRNRDNGKIYVGMTIGFQSRYHQHLSCFRRHKHGNPRLQQAVDSHGLNVFEFNVLEVVGRLATETTKQYRARLFQIEFNYIQVSQSTINEGGYNVQIDPRIDPVKANQPLTIDENIREVKRIKYLLFKGYSIRAINYFLQRQTAGAISRGVTYKDIKLEEQDISSLDSTDLLLRIETFNQQRIKDSRASMTKAVQLKAQTRFATLHEKQVIEIKRLLDEGLSIRQLANEFKVSCSSVEKIRSGKTWKHITGIQKGSTVYINHWSSGEQHRDAKLTIDEVRQIKQELATGKRISDIVRQFSKVKWNTIRAIKDGKTWRHVQI